MYFACTVYDIGLLCFCFAGTMDVATTKLMSIHVEALLPPTSIELDIPQNVQVAALLGVGLVFQGTAHRHIAEVLLSEIGNIHTLQNHRNLHGHSVHKCYLLTLKNHLYLLEIYVACPERKDTLHVGR